MNRAFKAAKVQLMMVSEGHENGTARTFSHLNENVSVDQIQKLGTLVEGISGAKFDNAVVTESYTIAK